MGTVFFVRVFVAAVGTFAISSSADARSTHQPIPVDRAPASSERHGDAPRSAATTYLREDTLSFGSIGVDGFAILDEEWTWDHGGADPFEGWVAADRFMQGATYFRHITDALWRDGDNLVSAPILSGAGSLWVGAYENEGDSFCWTGGGGYGNGWCQSVESPVLTHDGISDVSLSFTYFNDTELDFDYSVVLLRRIPSGEEISLNGTGFTGQLGLASNHPTGSPVGTSFGATITAGDLAGETQFQVVFKMVSDHGGSDEDGAFDSLYGPFGADDVSLSGGLTGGDVTYEFESGLGGWSPVECREPVTFLGVQHISTYMIGDPCGCALSGNVLELHDENGEHSYGNFVAASSNPVDILRDVVPNLSGQGGGISVSARWDQYSELPRGNGVFFRPGWDYFPYVCPPTGIIQWSGRVGADNFFYVGNDPVCEERVSVLLSNHPPNGVEQIRFVYELYSSCDAFGIPPDACTGTTNFTPLLDNVSIEFTRALAPAMELAPGTQYQDGYAQSNNLSPHGVGRADVTLNINFGNTTPFILGDSLCVSGPASTYSTRWESRLWFRIGREAPGNKPVNYNAWKTTLADGRNIVGSGAEFTFAWMDSFQQGPIAARNKFVSFLRESGEDDFNGGAGELTDRNEIIRDDVLLAGTRIDYFVTSNYTATQNENFLLPDTTGGFTMEFEILPRWFKEGTEYKFPCLLYVDAYNLGAEVFIEDALDAIGRDHDRYDYLDAASNWKAPMAEGSGASNNGIPLTNLIGYNAVLLNTGTLGERAMWPEDFAFLSDWLTTWTMCGNRRRQGLIINGDSSGEMLANQAPAVLVGSMGASFVAGSYNTYGSDLNSCARLELPTAGGKYDTSNSTGDYDYDAYGNWCPRQFDFDVLGTASSGVGNRAYVNTGTLAETNYAQIAHQVDAQVDGMYRTVLDGVSYHHLSERTMLAECSSDSASIGNAAASEIRSALEWIFGEIGVCDCVVGVDPPPFEAGTLTRLYPNTPNPFNPRTTLRFSLAQAEDVELSIFDAGGRGVRTLVDARVEAGLQEIVWDGTDDAGHPVASGIFWSQLRAGEYTSSKKMVVLR